jgi:hypothetical protein
VVTDSKGRCSHARSDGSTIERNDGIGLYIAQVAAERLCVEAGANSSPRYLKCFAPHPIPPDANAAQCASGISKGVSVSAHVIASGAKQSRGKLFILCSAGSWIASSLTLLAMTAFPSARLAPLLNDQDDACVTLPASAGESRHNLRAASAFAISFRTPYLWNGMMKKR